MNKTVSELSKSASRALSALYTKSLKAGGMTIEVFEKIISVTGRTSIVLRQWIMGNLRLQGNTNCPK